MEKVQKNRGRPPIGNAKDKILQIRVTESQKNKIKSLAKEKGLTVTELILNELKIK